MEQQAKYISLRYVVRFIAIFGFLFTVFTTAAREKVVLQLSWKHQFQFAGYYAALEKGFYAEAGFDVEIREATQTTNTLEDILSGKAQFAIGDAETLIYFLDGNPIVLVASIYQHSPSVLMVKASSSIYTPQDLIGKKLMVGEGYDGLEILTMLFSEGVKKDQVTLVSQSFSVNELLSDKVDALGAYISNETYFMEKFGIPYRIIKPTSYGIDFYSDCLYCSQQYLKLKPEKVSKFREASIRGWEYALANQEELAQIIITKYNPSKTIDHLLFEANKIKELVNADFIEIGHTNKWRWQRIGEHLYQQGIIQKMSSIDEFIYTPHHTNKYLWLKVFSIIAASLLLVAFVFAFFHHRLSRSVEQRTKDIQALVNTLEERNAQIEKINSDLRRAQQLAKDLDESRLFFFSKIIEELKSPVKSMIDLTEQISKPNIAGEKKQAICTRLVYNNKIVFDFLNDIIAIANYNENWQGTPFETINISDYLNNLIEKVKTDQRVNTRININPNLKGTAEFSSLNVLLDNEKLTRILIKLIKNSIKFTEQGQIEIGCENDSHNSILFWVKDSGLGIKPDELKRINTFLHNPIQGNASGIGLGLWVCKNLIHQMRGSIWAESNTESQKDEIGSKFTVQVPCVFIENIEFDEKENVEIMPVQEIPASSLKGKTMLILDDYVQNYNLIKALTKGSGLNLLYTSNPYDMLSVIKSSEIIDVLMVNVDNSPSLGLYPIPDIRNHIPSLPILAHTSGINLYNESIQKMGFDEVIQIPPKEKSFIGTLEKHLAWKLT